MKIVIEDKDLINQSKEYLKSLLSSSLYFNKIENVSDLDKLVDITIDECWFFTGKITIQQEFQMLKNSLIESINKNELNVNLNDTDYKIIISEGILAISTVKSKKYDTNGNDMYQRNEIDCLIRKK